MPEGQTSRLVITSPDGAWRDFVFGTGLIVVIALLTYSRPSLLDKPPDPSSLNADPRPDWYLLRYFALLTLIPPQLEGYVMILAPALSDVALGKSTVHVGDIGASTAARSLRDTRPARQ
jgi:hypothetical protein